MRKREIVEFTQCQHRRFGFVRPDGFKIEIKDPIWGLSNAGATDLYTGYRNVSWPEANIFHDSFVVNKDAVNPFKIMLMGAHDLGVQETESLIVDGGYLGGAYVFSGVL